MAMTTTADLPSRSAGSQSGAVVEQGRRGAIPPSAVLAKHLGAYVAIRRKIPPEMFEFRRRYAHLRFPEDSREPEFAWAEALRSAIAAAEQLPRRAELDEIRVKFRAAAEGHASRRDIARIVGAMADAIPTFDVGKAPGYLDGLAFALEIELHVDPFSTEALAAAAYEALCRARFVPEPQVLIDAIRKRQGAFATHAEFLAIILETLDAVDKLRAEGATAADREDEKETR